MRKIARVGKFSPHDAALDSAVGGADRLSVGDGSPHPGHLRVPNQRVNFENLIGGEWAGLPVIHDLSVELNLDDLTTLEKNATRWFEGNLRVGSAL